MKAVYRTDRGRVRQHNEDNGGIFVNAEGTYLAVVADGMGGHRAGDVASELTLNNLQSYWEISSEMNRAEIAEKWLKEHVLKVNQSLFQHSQNNLECEGMGTTLVAVIYNENFSTIAHIGDSRCYLLNDMGFNQVTEDHSLVNELVKSGQISKEDAEHHPRKNVLLRALGTESSVQVDVKTIGFEEGDTLLLCSDGLSNKVSEQEMVDILQSNQPLEYKADQLVELANQHGGEDNITLIIIDFTCRESG